MKETIVPYLLNNPSWWSGINITNHSPVAAIVFIQYFPENGGIGKHTEIRVEPGFQKTFNYDAYPKGWARVLSDDNVAVSVFMGETGKAPMNIQVESRPLVLGNVIKRDKSIVPIVEAPYIRNYSTDGNYLAGEFWDIVKLIALYLRIKFPDRAAANLEIVQGCPKQGACQGNPAHTTPAGRVFDINYFTMDVTNNTQWPPPTVPIWTAPDPSGSVTNMFDALRNAEFVIVAHKIFPKSEKIADQRLKVAMSDAVWRAHSDAARTQFDGSIYADTPCNKNHHTHMHISQGPDERAVNWEARL